jgi:hypothetical protein
MTNGESGKMQKTRQGAPPRGDRVTSPMTSPMNERAGVLGGADDSPPSGATSRPRSPTGGQGVVALGFTQGNTGVAELLWRRDAWWRDNLGTNSCSMNLEAGEGLGGKLIQGNSSPSGYAEGGRILRIGRRYKREFKRARVPHDA